MLLTSSLSDCASFAVIAFAAAPECAVDLSKDGLVGLEDLVRFVSAYVASDPSADFNGDGSVGKDDLPMFLSAYLAAYLGSCR